MSDAPARRREAALAGHVGDAETARRLLHDLDPAVHATALGALERAGALTSIDVTAALTDPAPEVRRRGAELAVAHVDVPLVDALADRDPSVVETAAWAAGEREQPGSALVGVLAALATEHGDPLCREAAVAALGAIGDGAALPAILAATADKPAVRRRAVLALAPFEGEEVDAAIQAALTDRDWQVRQAAEDLLIPPPD